MTSKTSKNRLLQALMGLGPGIITAALVFGPSKMTITSKLGAEYGYSMLWVVVVAIFFMLIFTNMGARIGLHTDVSLLSNIRNNYDVTFYNLDIKIDIEKKFISGFNEIKFLALEDVSKIQIDF